MRKTLLILGMLAVSLPLVACATSTASQSVSAVVTCDEFGQEPAISREVHIPAGGTVTLTLCSNPSTGFSWEEAKIADAAVVQQLSRQSVAPAKKLAGAPGEEVWTFKALKKGQTTVAIDYSRPWAGGEKGTWKLVLTVVVQ